MDVEPFLGVKLLLCLGLPHKTAALLRLNTYHFITQKSSLASRPLASYPQSVSLNSRSLAVNLPPNRVPLTTTRGLVYSVSFLNFHYHYYYYEEKEGVVAGDSIPETLTVKKHPRAQPRLWPSGRVRYL